MEKTLRWFAIVFFAAGFMPLATSYVAAQPCSGGTMAGTLTPTIPWQIAPCVKGGEYYEFPAVAGNFYSFSYCMAGGNSFFDTQITILDDSGNFAGGFADDECGLQSHLMYWFCGTTGTYRVLINEFDCIANNVCSALAYKCEYPPNSAGANCGNAIAIGALPYQGDGLSTCLQGNDYTSSDACGSTYMDGEELVFTYNGTAGECISIFTRNTFVYTGLFLLDGCPNIGGTSCLATDEAAAGVPYISNYTLPATQTYYIVVGKDPIFGPPCTPFDIEVTNCVAIGVGDSCANAFPIPSIPYNQYGFTTGGFGNEYTSADACASPWLDGDDFVFSYNSPGNECISIGLDNTFSWAAFLVFDGCPDAPGTNCIAERGEPGGNPRLRTVNLATPGTYYIVVSTWPTPQSTPFNITIDYCTPACNRNPNAADNCSAPTPVSFGVLDTVCGFADVNFTPDVSTDLDNEFCGSIENNGWFTFIADSTDMTLQIAVTTCLSGFGIQGMVFETSDCINYTPRSNCFNPQIEADGVLRATGLTPGNTYLLMIDGYAGDDCEFEISRAGSPLPVEWGAFNAQVVEDYNVQLDWNTVMEINNRGFHIQRGQTMERNSSEDNIRWENVGWIDSQGDSPDGHTYSWMDHVQYTGQPYFYRIMQLDYDGMSEFSEVRTVEITGPEQNQLMAVYPNPASDMVTIETYTTEAGPIIFSLFDMSGKMLRHQRTDASGEGIYNRELPVHDLSAGMYFYTVTINGAVFNGKLNIAH